MNVIWPILHSSVIFIIWGCGAKSSSDDPVTTTPTATTATSLASDTETSTGIIAAQIDELTSNLNAGDASTNASAAALLEEPRQYISGEITRTRLCTANTTDKTAQVSITFSGSASKTVGKYEISETASGKETRDWSNSSNREGVSCTANGYYAKISWKTPASVSGLKLIATTARTRSIISTFKSRKGETKTRTATWTESGTRTVTWSVPSGATTTATTSKSIESSVSKSYTLTKVDGSTIDLSATHATLSNSPLVITIERNSSGVPQKHTIASGTMSASKSGSFYVTNKFENVVFDLTGSDPCSPSSGKITTSIFSSATDTTAQKTYTISFSAGDPEISGDSDATDNLTTNLNHKCDFKDGD